MPSFNDFVHLNRTHTVMKLKIILVMMMMIMITVMLKVPREHTRVSIQVDGSVSQAVQDELLVDNALA